MRVTRNGLPLAVWVGVLGVASVLTVGLVAGLVLDSEGSLGDEEFRALGLGAGAGLMVVLATVLGSTRLSGGLRKLHQQAVQRLAEPGMEVGGSRQFVARTTSEVIGLARTLDALHLRVRMADQLSDRHRRDAETAGAGVFELLSGLVAAEEGARGQLAAELHDTVAQSLVVARGMLAVGVDGTVDLAKLGAYVEEAEEQLRGVMARTRPPALREGDLASAVTGLREDMELRYGLRVEVEWPASPYPLPLVSAITVYRFFQEALLNVVKHADVDDAVLTLHVEESSVVAVVRDAGPGFDPSDVRPVRGRHVGLGLLRERARLAGGSLTVDSSPGLGTTLTLRLPRPQGPSVAAPRAELDEAIHVRRAGDVAAL